MELTCKEIIADEPTINHRIYSKEVLQKAIDEYNAKDYKFGTLGLSDNVNSDGTFTGMNPHNIAFSVTGISLVGNEIVIEFEILYTPMGEVLKELIDKCQMRFANIGSMDLKDVDGNFIVKDLKILYPWVDND
jgi:hypothetical protein